LRTSPSEDHGASHDRSERRPKLHSVGVLLVIYAGLVEILIQSFISGTRSLYSRTPIDSTSIPGGSKLGFLITRSRSSMVGGDGSLSKPDTSARSTSPSISATTARRSLERDRTGTDQYGYGRTVPEIPK
jgi:hypothetical protein